MYAIWLAEQPDASWSVCLLSVLVEAKYMLWLEAVW
jgi:hypothetical protein